MASETKCHALGCGGKSGQASAALVYAVRVANRSSNGWGVDSDIAYTLDRSGPSAVALKIRTRDNVSVPVIGSEIANTLLAPQGRYDKAMAFVLEEGLSWVVRYLTPRECERLQGIPDEYTLIPWRKGLAADSPRYKAIGNGMAVPCVVWLLARIDKAKLKR